MLLLAIVTFLVAGVSLVAGWRPSLNPFGEETIDRSGPSVLKSLTDLSEYHAASAHYDVILLDLGLPDAQGLEAIRRIRAAASRAPLVVLTGHDDDTMAVRALQEGAQDYLIKG